MQIIVFIDFIDWNSILPISLENWNFKKIKETLIYSEYQITIKVTLIKLFKLNASI